MGGKNNSQSVLGQWKDPTGDLATAANRQNQNNRPLQSTPWAMSQWTQDANGNWAQNTGFTGGLANTAQSLTNQAGQNMATPFSFSQFGAIPTGDSARDQAINAAYGQASSRLDPQWNQRESMERTRLMNQGFDPNTEAFRHEMGQFGLARNDAYGSAMNNAIMQGTAAGNSAFQNNMASRQQSIAEALRQRGMPLEEMAKLQGLMAMPDFNADNATAQLAGTGAGLNQQGWAAYNRNFREDQDASNQMTADIVGGGAKLFGSLASMMSDERVKQNIVRHKEEALPGVPYASFEYKHEPGVTYRGVIAQDLEKVAPQYVKEIGGIKHVDYSFLNRGKK